MNRLAIAYKVKSTRTFDKRPSDVPEDWLIFVAPRPLPGTKTWRGSGGFGWHYAALDPKDENYEMFLSRIARDQGNLVLYTKEEEFLSWLKKEVEDPEEYAQILQDSDLVEMMKQNFIRDSEDKEVTL